MLLGYVSMVVTAFVCKNADIEKVVMWFNTIIVVFLISDSGFRLVYGKFELAEFVTGIVGTILIIVGTSGYLKNS